MGSFVEIKNLGQALRLLEKRGTALLEGSNERKNLKNAFEDAEKTDQAMGILNTRCKCGQDGDFGAFVKLKRDGSEYKKWTETDDVPFKLCKKCIQLGMILHTGYGMGPQDANIIMSMIWKMIKIKGGKKDVDKQTGVQRTDSKESDSSKGDQTTKGKDK